MGCVCCSLSSFVSIVLNALERISLCTVCALLTCCLLFTIMTVLIIGVGIGYHYCFVQNSVEAMEKAAKAAGALRSAPAARQGVMRSMDRAVQRGFAHRISRREAEGQQPPDTRSRFNDTLPQQYLLKQNRTMANFTNLTSYLMPAA